MTSPELATPNELTPGMIEHLQWLEVNFADENAARVLQAHENRTAGGNE